MEHLTRIRQLVRRVRRRLRAQMALQRLLRFGASALFLFGVTVLLVKGRVLPPVATWVAGGVALAIAAGAVLSALLRRWDDIALAARVDESGDLHSRLGTALAFAREPAPTAFQRAAIDDAASALERADPASAAPWRWAAFTGAALFAAIALAINVPAVFAVSFPVGAGDGVGLARLDIPPQCAVIRPPVVVQELDEEALEVLAAAVEEERNRAADEEVASFLADLNDLIRKLQAGEITPEEAFRQLAALEEAQEAWNEAHATDLDAVGKHIEEAAKKQRRAGEQIDPMLEALREQRWKEAAEALEKAADALDEPEERGLSRRDRDRLRKDMEELAQNLETERQRQLDRLQRDRDRLARQEEQEKDRFSQRDRDRLKKTERELEQLRREQQEMSEARRQLERLQREMSKAAQEMMRRQQEQEQGGQGASAEAMRQAAEMMRRMGQNGQGARQMRVAQGRMVDVREMVRRAAQQGRDGQGEDGQGKDGQQQAGEDGQQPGQGGEGGKQGEMGRFLVRAGGQEPGGKGQSGERGQGRDGQGKDGQGEGEGGQKGMMLSDGEGGGKDADMMLLGQGNPGGKGGGVPMPVPGAGDQPGAGDRPGDGVGEGHDPRMMGDKTRLDGAREREEFVRGQDTGEGESESVVLQTAASKGFTAASYRRVHQDYSEVVEDAIERQEIPAGARRYVRRYFELIRPR